MPKYPTSTRAERETAHRAVVDARIALRFDLLLRDRAAYLAAIGLTSSASDEDLALGDLTTDPKCAALKLASSAERRALDHAAWQAVKANLGLVRTLVRGRFLARFGLDEDLLEGLVLDAMAEALTTWDPSRASLGVYAGIRAYSAARSWAKTGPRRHRGEESTAGAPRLGAPVKAVEMDLDPVREMAVERALLGLNAEERAILATLVDDESPHELAAELGAKTSRVVHRRAKIRRYLVDAIEADAQHRRARCAAAGV